MNRDARRGWVRPGISRFLVQGFLILFIASSLSVNCAPAGRDTVVVDPAAETPATPYPAPPETGRATASGTIDGGVTATISGILPGDRLYDWGRAGVPGGIPNRTVVYKTLTPSHTLAEINAAIAACPSGQVVYLAAGQYNVGQVTFGMKSGVTLRGAGAGKTVIYTTAENAIVNSNHAYSESSGIALAAGGGHKGSTRITLASAPASNFVAGNIVAITQDASPDAFAAGLGIYYRTGLTSSVYDLSPIRIFRHLARITGVAGKVITLATPLPLDFSDNLNPKAYAKDGTATQSLCGVEDLTIDGKDSADCALLFYSADRCWLKDVEVKDVIGTLGQIRLEMSVECEVRRCFFHNAAGYPGQSDGYGIMLNYGASNCLLVDNIADRTASFVIANGASSCAVIYNYVHDTCRAQRYSRGITVNHGPHGFMFLMEGNILPTVVNDGYHGSTSHVVVFRNSINGLNSTEPIQRKLLNLCRGSYFHSVVGNILGDPSWRPDYYDQPYPASRVGAVYALGWPSADSLGLADFADVPWTNWTKSTSAPDADVARTLLRHGNYDHYHGAAEWDSRVASRTIPDSLIYSSKPDFFGTLHWPPIGPDVNGLVTNIPAKARWDAFRRSGGLDDIFRAR